MPETCLPYGKCEGCCGDASPYWPIAGLLVFVAWAFMFRVAHGLWEPARGWTE